MATPALGRSPKIRHHGEGTASTVLEAQAAADDYAREAGWVLVD